SPARGRGRLGVLAPVTGITHGLPTNTGATNPTFSPGPECERTDDFHCFATADRFNFAPYNLLLTPSERKTVFGQVRFAFNDNVGGYVRALYNQRDSANQAAPEPFFLGTAAAIHNPYGESTLVISALNPYNPFGFDLTTVGDDANLFLIGRRPVEGGPRRYEQDVETWYVAAGLDGSFDMGDRPWDWDVNVVRSESKAEQTNYGSYNLRRIN